LERESTAATDSRLTIGFRCIEASHSEEKNPAARPTGTVNAGKWAICASGFADGHTWKATGIDYREVFPGHVVAKRDS
jgi:hypothetical protein